MVVTSFLDPLTVMVRSDLSSIRDSVPKISGLDLDTFTLVRAEVLDFQDHFRFSLEIFSLTCLSYFSYHTWLHLVFYLTLLFLLFLTKKIKGKNPSNLIFLLSS